MWANQETVQRVPVLLVGGFSLTGVPELPVEFFKIHV